MKNGRIFDTYLHRLQNDSPDFPSPFKTIGVVRKPMYGLSAAVDENKPDLGPPPDLLYKTKDLEKEYGNPEAWERANFEQRYRDYIRDSKAVQSELKKLLNLLRQGTNVVLVCYENTDKKRCHRTLLKNILQNRLNS